ncbi:MAG: hypothetical protein ACJASB_003789 [Shewanella psychromarinicola]|uniref:hypothetical protein n=1 Tax=Shewanella psychromarinicola TaxID=2487742 RepID=UPI003EEC5F84
MCLIATLGNFCGRVIILGHIDVVQAAYLLTLARTYTNEKHRQVIEPLWQSLVMQISSVIALKPTEDELIALQQAKILLQ